ncbi:hypothetical protein PG994_003162 [Apiospora phragmitis]|uniref:Uncharacterized protein n=1 Tax=Apiospora phragmitis TaxID=2905665 RepID=A0ABR1WA68_9PEZI
MSGISNLYLSANGTSSNLQDARPDSRNPNRILGWASPSAALLCLARLGQLHDPLPGEWRSTSGRPQSPLATSSRADPYQVDDVLVVAVLAHQHTRSSRCRSARPGRVSPAAGGSRSSAGVMRLFAVRRHGCAATGRREVGVAGSEGQSRAGSCVVRLEEEAEVARVRDGDAGVVSGPLRASADARAEAMSSPRPGFPCRQQKRWRLRPEARTVYGGRVRLRMREPSPVQRLGLQERSGTRRRSPP